MEKNLLKSLIRCPVCDSYKCDGIIKYENVPQYQNVNIPNKNEALNSFKGDICISICLNCGFIFNGLFEENNTTYTENYDNGQYSSTIFKEYLNEIEKNISKYISLENRDILEVGCGQGDLIKIIAKNNNCQCYGYDPSYIGECNLFDNKLTVFKEYFSNESCAKPQKKFDVIIFRHVIEHLENPLMILSLLKECLKDNGIIYIETPSLNYILENNVIFDFLYEHCSYFNKNSIENLLNMAKLKLISFDYKFSEQYMAIIAGHLNEEKLLDKNYIKPTIEIMNLFERGKKLRIEQIKSKIKVLNKYGNVCLWGAGAKGVMCCNLFDSSKQYIDSVVDIKKSKTGNYIPLTGHLIINPSEIIERRIKSVIVVNPNYFDEVKYMVENIDKTITVLNICSL